MNIVRVHRNFEGLCNLRAFDVFIGFIENSRLIRKVSTQGGVNVCVFHRLVEDDILVFIKSFLKFRVFGDEFFFLPFFVPGIVFFFSNLENESFILSFELGYDFFIVFLFFLHFFLQVKHISIGCEFFVDFFQ